MDTLPKFLVQLPNGLKFDLKFIFFVLTVVECNSSADEIGNYYLRGKIPAIKIVRAYPDIGLGLKEAKDLVEWVFKYRQLLNDLKAKSFSF